MSREEFKGRPDVDKYLAKLRARKLAQTTIQKYWYYLKMFLEYVDKDPSRLSMNDVENWRYEMAVNRGYEPETIWASMIIVRKFLRFLGATEIAENMEMPKRPSHPPVEKEVWLLPEEEQMLVQKSKEVGIRDYAIIKLFLSSGVRAGELRNINVEDVDFKNQTIQVRHGKGDKSRYVPFDTETKHAIKEYMKERKEGSEALFTSKWGRRLSYDRVLHIVKECAVLAGISKRISPHKLRHTFITKVIEKTKDVPLAQKLAGHSEIKTTMRYHHTTHKEVMAKYKKFFDSHYLRVSLPKPLSNEDILRRLDSKFLKGELPYDTYMALRKEYTEGNHRAKQNHDNRDMAYL